MQEWCGDNRLNGWFMTFQERAKTFERPDGAGQRAPKAVLIVEDNELNMKLFHDLLDAHGYATLQTRNGMDALGLARKHRPALILMDIQLPEVSGLEVTRWLKEDDDPRPNTRARCAWRTVPVVPRSILHRSATRPRVERGPVPASVSRSRAAAEERTRTDRDRPPSAAGR